MMTGGGGAGQRVWYNSCSWGGCWKIDQKGTMGLQLL